MKKKLCYYLIIVLTLFSFNSVLAEGNSCEGLKEIDLPRLGMSSYSNIDIRNEFNAVFNRNSELYYQMTLDGHKALCIDEGNKARPGDVYQYVGLSLNIDYNMAFGFYSRGSYPGDNRYHWAISQYIAWNGLSLGPSAYETLWKIVQGDSRLTNELLYKNGILGGNESDRKRIIGSKLITLIHPFRNSGPYYIWKNLTKEKEGVPGQRVVTDLAGCKEPTPETACPTGQMQKTNRSVACYPSKGGNSFTGYQNIAISGDRTNVSVASESGAVGEELREIGSFCKLYCQEYGIAILPGAIGEALPLGSYMIWPTSENNHNDKFYKSYYPLKFKGILSCKIGVIPDAGLPFACKRNPIGEYETAYDYVQRNKDVTDPYPYKRKIVTTLEEMRLEITTWAKDGPGDGDIYAACESIHDDKNFADDQYVYSIAVKIMEDASREYDEAKRKADNFSGQKFEKKCQRPFGNTCPDNVYIDVQTEAYALVIAERDKKEAIWKAKQDIVTEIGKSIDACVKYTTYFEVARQILKDYKLCAEFEATEDLYSFSSSVSFNYSDKQYNTGDVNSKGVKLEGMVGELGDETLFDKIILTNEYKATELQTPELLESNVNSIKSREIEIQKSETYELYTGYKYIDKESKEYLINPPNNANYSTINTSNGIIPTSYDNEIAKDYYMTLSGISFGMAGFGINDDGTSTKYVCPVQFTKVSNTTCVCPEGTKMEGMDIIGLIANNKMTCADAQLLYCDSDENPPHEDMYCPNMPEISIGACVNSGYTKSECISKLCNERYTCKNTNGVGGKMDITSCVQTKMMQGLTRQQAIDYCDSVVCPIGKTIIYRTIRLENPFPSYDPTQNLYNGLTTGMFNNNTRGRYPGSNWNGILTVYNKIRNNRSGRLETNESTAINRRTTIGTTIYQTKEPLYTFVLDGGTIQEIRRYNESRTDGYNDFNSSKADDNMDCRINDSTACVSAFVHAARYGLRSGECFDNTASSNFYTCARR